MQSIFFKTLFQKCIKIFIKRFKLLNFFLTCSYTHVLPGNQVSKKRFDSVLSFLDNIKERLKTLSQKFKVADLVKEEDPISVANKVSGASIAIFCGEFSVAVEGGSVLRSSDFSTALLTSLKVIYVLNLKYCDSVKCVYGVVEAMCGISPTTVNIGNTARIVIKSFP